MVLYIDDELINLELFRLHFQKICMVFTASNAEEGLEILSKEDSIKIVFTDFNMPEINGVEFLEKAKEIFPNISYFILSACGFNTPIIDALEKGLAQKLYQKPFDVRKLTELIESIVFS